VSRLTQVAGARDEQLRTVALRIRNRMNRLRLSESELARRCSLMPGAHLDAPSRDRLAKLLMNCKKVPEKSAARLITAGELRAIADALEVSFEWLVGQYPPHDPVYWDLLADPRRAGHVLHLLSEHEDSSGESLIWADHLRAALTTPDFMRAYNRSLAEELAFALTASEKRAAVETFDRIGDARRRRVFFQAHQPRAFNYTQVIFLSDLERVADGADEYARIPRGLREECLRELAALVSGARARVSLCVADEKSAGRFARALRGYRAVGVFGHGFTLWEYRSGAAAWSEHRRHVTAHRRLIREARSHSVNRNQQETASLLLDLASRTR
jgi:hypothetical protein